MIDTSLFDTTMMDSSFFYEMNDLDLTKFYDCGDNHFDTAMSGVAVEDDFDGLLFSGDDFDMHMSTPGAITPALSTEETSEEEAFVASTLSEPIKRKQRTPTKKRRKRRSAEMEDSSTSSTSVPPTKLLVTSSQLTSDHTGVDIESALSKLAQSMRRSEMSRNEIIRRQKQLESDERVRSAFPVSNSSLSTKLDQSRSMLQSYIAQMKGPMMS